MTRHPPDEPDGTAAEEFTADFPLETAPSPPARPRRPRPPAPAASSGPWGPARSARRPPAYIPPPPRQPSNWLNAALGFSGALILGLLGLVILLMVQRSAPPPGTGARPILSPGSGTGAGPAPPAASSPPPRMSLDVFKKLYDDPAQRPLIIDVRAADIYAQGHIVGARSLPEAELDARYQEIPKDTLVVLYCQ